MTARTSVFGIMGFPNSEANQADLVVVVQDCRSFNFWLPSFEIWGTYMHNKNQADCLHVSL